MSYRCELLIKALWNVDAEEISKLLRVEAGLRRNGYTSVTLSDTFVPADEVIVVKQSRKGSPKSIEVVCPRCGRIGCLVVSKRVVRGYKYYIRHSNGKEFRICTFTVDSPHWEFLDKVYRLIRQEWRL